MGEVVAFFEALSCKKTIELLPPHANTAPRMSSQQRGRSRILFIFLADMSSGSDREMGLGPEEVVNASGQALLEDGEQSLLQRSGVQSRLSGMSLCCASGGTSGFKTKVEKGTLYLTTRRILFVAKKNQRILSLRFSDIFKERFNQPIFGCNNISGRVRVDYNGEADSYLEWRFYFLKVRYCCMPCIATCKNLVSFYLVLHSVRAEAMSGALNSMAFEKTRPVPLHRRKEKTCCSSLLDRPHPFVILWCLRFARVA